MDPETTPAASCHGKHDHIDGKHRFEGRALPIPEGFYRTRFVFAAICHFQVRSSPDQGGQVMLGILRQSGDVRTIQRGVELPTIE